MKQVAGKLVKLLLAVGPGIFAIGYTVGTGSVTAMAKAGSQFGMKLLWVLALSCIFSWVLMEAAGRFALVSGETAVNGCRKHLPGGKGLALLMVIGVVTGQWCCLSGLVGLSSSALYEGLRLFIPSLTENTYWPVLGIAATLMVLMYALLWHGGYSFFEKILVIFVTILGLSFIVSMFVVLPPAGEIAGGLVPRIPNVPGAALMVAAFVGTTMAAPTFVVRPLLLKAKGWGRDDVKQQSVDAFAGAFLMFIVSGAVMACAAGALFSRGLEVNHVLDMVHTLEPVAGKYAVSLFLVGTLSAGLSSVFPICMVAPLLISDYRKGEFDSRSKLFRILCAVACLIGLTIPILGANPIAAQIATQVSQVFILPLVIAVLFVLANKRDLMGSHRAGPLLNTGMIVAFAFSLVMSFLAVKGLIGFFKPLENASTEPKWMVCVTDQRYTQVDGDEHVYEDAQAGALVTMDVSSVPPKSFQTLENVPASLIGPPVSVAVAPNQKFALVTGAMKVNPENSAEQIPDTVLSVVRLMPGAPEIIQQIELGLQPSGVEISRDGTRALVANRAAGSVSLLSLTPAGQAELLDTFAVAPPESSVSHAAFSPDGTRVLVTLNKAGKVLFCSLENDQMKVLQQVTCGDGPYCAEFAPDGKSAVIGNVYGGTLSLLKISDQTADVVDTIPVGILAEGIDISPDGLWLVVNCLENTNMTSDNPAHRESAMVVLFQKQGATFVTMDSIRVDGIPQAAVFTPDGQYVAVASNEKQAIRFYKLETAQLKETNIEVSTSGGPAAVRVSM
ncbi:Nramp family divalent metal transporter [Tichowtungia aerotolerans]|uniref:Beta-propeller fold lactonase family protein n=1 Tax=Tichowtungia aerotolerans TaxID=2697043 RepID=A0A6P1MGY5_9BACT|nr:Nramp family divalent metal transporter [Tichowtungia aerotolerans]QHI70345.1 beta-propeller fold lactonase family protein [Tichowtungia aerotolerans]